MHTPNNDSTWAYANDRAIEHPVTGIDGYSIKQTYDPYKPSRRQLGEAANAAMREVKELVELVDSAELFTHSYVSRKIMPLKKPFLS